jgi:hypothetical protein
MDSANFSVVPFEDPTTGERYVAIRMVNLVTDQEVITLLPREGAERLRHALEVAVRLIRDDVVGEQTSRQN